MTLTALSRRTRPGSLQPTRLGRAESAPARTVLATPATPSQVVLMVDLISPEGRTWWAVGVGDTLADAIAFAHDSCPTDTTWQPTQWNDLYGD